MNLEKTKPFVWLGGFYLLVSLLLRIVFIFHPITNASFGMAESLKILFVGLLADVFVFILASSFLALYFLFLSNSKCKKPYGYIIFGLLVAALIYTAFVPGNIFKQYGGAFPEIATSFVGLKTLLFGLMLFLPTQRIRIRNILYFITLFLYVLLIIFNAVSEYFFWNEFGVRSNFIAVDYLIYTNEVIGNIMESYPVLPLFSVIILLTTAVTWIIFRKTKNELLELPDFRQKLMLLGTFLLLCVLSLFALPKLDAFKTNNTFAQEIQANGFPKFYHAFTHNELDYFQFYPTLKQSVAEEHFLKQFQPPQLARKLFQEIRS